MEAFTNFFCLLPLWSAPATDGSAHDVAFLSADHIVIAEWDGNAVVSRDGGKSWTSSPMGAPASELFVGPNGSVWGFYRWHGIHESSSAALVASFDGGSQWTKIPLEPELLMPEAFVSTRGSEPIVLSHDGQLWAHTPGAPESVDQWKKLGTPNPDRAGHAGASFGAHTYVSTGKSVCLSSDQGQTWKSSTQKASALFADEQSCWLVDDKGTVSRTPLGKLEWKVLATVSDVDIPFAIAVNRQRVYLATEGTGWRAYGPILEKDGSLTKLSGLDGKQGYSVRVDPLGRSWFVAQGLFLEEPAAKRWKRVWPK